MVALIVKVLSFVSRERFGAKVSDVEVNPGGGANVTAEHSAPAGVDCQPLSSDSAVVVPKEGSDRFVVVGYFDPKNDPKAGPGEYRTYARNAAGAEVVEIWIKSDGSIRGENANGYFELESGGDFVANDAKLLTNGDVVTSDGISLRDHTHAQGNDGGGSVEVETEPPT